MRHQKKFNHLGRTASHRKAMLMNMANSLILHKRVTTTVAKAKALRVYVEPLLTRSKTDSTHSRRIVFSSLKNKFAVSELFREVAVKIAARPGGYTRILRTGFRQGDAAELCIIELVDYNENMLGIKAEETKQKTIRRRRPVKKTKEEELKTSPDEIASETIAESQETESANEQDNHADDVKEGK